jgi:hypothetical protein
MCVFYYNRYHGNAVKVYLAVWQNNYICVITSDFPSFLTGDFLVL